MYILLKILGQYSQVIMSELNNISYLKKSAYSLMDYHDRLLNYLLLP